MNNQIIMAQAAALIFVVTTVPNSTIAQELQPECYMFVWFDATAQYDWKKQP